MKLWGPAMLLLTGATLFIGGCVPGAGGPAPVADAGVAVISPLVTPAADLSPTTEAPVVETPAVDAPALELPPTVAAEEPPMPADAANAATAGIPGDILNAVLDDAAQQLGVAPSTLVVTRAEAVTWNDGALGCPEPGMFYTQALVDGYWIVVEADGQSLDYRVQSNGFFRVCDRPGPGNRVRP